MSETRLYCHVLFMFDFPDLCLRDTKKLTIIYLFQMNIDAWNRKRMFTSNPLDTVIPVTKTIPEIHIGLSVSIIFRRVIHDRVIHSATDPTLQ